mmetsp:Transcript_3480/g.8696  ORF Transcript_3480/g.8696 Transcript_3480/m.8696 type:complete len:217 (+) Transcript_3480:936-1586(+)
MAHRAHALARLHVLEHARRHGPERARAHHARVPLGLKPRAHHHRSARPWHRRAAGVSRHQLRPPHQPRELHPPHRSLRPFRAQGCRHQLHDPGRRAHAARDRAVLQHQHRGDAYERCGADLSESRTHAQRPPPEPHSSARCSHSAPTRSSKPRRTKQRPWPCIRPARAQLYRAASSHGDSRPARHASATAYRPRPRADAVAQGTANFFIINTDTTA